MELVNVSTIEELKPEQDLYLAAMFLFTLISTLYLINPALGLDVCVPLPKVAKLGGLSQ